MTLIQQSQENRILAGLDIGNSDWYTPVSKPSLENVGENVWELDMYFDEYLLYPNESVVEGNIVLYLIKCLRLVSQVFLVNFIK